jgi:ABC-type branched-subunit amino acid transport system substrate-binding protein
VAQKEYNDNGLLHGGVKVQLLIANSGSQTQYTDQVAEQIMQLVKTDPTVMAWPYSSRALEVIKTLTQASIPIVSQTSSSGDFTNLSPYFFRVAPTNKIQGIVEARFISPCSIWCRGAIYKPVPGHGVGARFISPSPDMV